MQNYSTTYISTAVLFLTFLTKALKLEIGSDALTTTIQVIVAIVSAVWILIERFKKGDVTPLGAKKSLE